VGADPSPSSALEAIAETCCTHARNDPLAGVVAPLAPVPSHATAYHIVRWPLATATATEPRGGSRW
jgi:hypothetical protein